ncbi:site-specific integrase [Peptostreptococcus faecalis]|uniref:site-specific integrase n=1 Tax=Peptostreptococcus faecalis TaxID=2045015 RepID=UPI000C7A156D|nr:tyrosine-type recombinase/integrase [Peptostreptococcus faecalis]
MPQYKDELRNTWYSSFYCNGKKHTKRGFKTKKEAKEYEIQFKAKKEGSSDIIFSILWDEYIKSCEGVFKTSTLIAKQNYYKSHIDKKLGNMKVIDITNLTIKNFIDDMLEDGRSKKTCNRVIQQINACIAWGKKYYNIKEVDKFDTFKVTVKERNIWTIDQFNTFLSRVDNFEYYVAFSMLFYLGIRVGELLAIKVSDIDGNVISITKTYSYIHRLTHTPKTNSSIRTVVMPEFLSEMIQNLISLKYKVESDDKLLSFDNPSNFRYYLSKYSYGLPEITAHDLRHSHATMLINNGADVISVSKRLGHSNPSITLKTYSHSYKGYDNVVADLLDDLKENNDEKYKK